MYSPSTRTVIIKIRRIAATILLSTLSTMSTGQTIEMFRYVAESVLQIEAGTARASGFIWSDPSRVVTALHVVDSSDPITAHYIVNGKIVASSEAVVERVLPDADLVLLRLLRPQNRTPLRVSLTAPNVKQVLDAVGFPLHVSHQMNTEVKVRFGGRQLRTLLSNKLTEQLQEYPDPNMEVLNLEGNVVPGLSGAPIVDKEGRVVGVVNGGLEDGAVGICWGIPAYHLVRLEQSSIRKLPLAKRSRQAFAADLHASVAPTRTLGALQLTKLRTRALWQLLLTADDPEGILRIAIAAAGERNLSMLEVSAFRFDVYQDFASGAVVVLPEGAQLFTKGEFIVASLGDDRVSTKIQSKSVLSFSEAKAHALKFERQVTEYVDGMGVNTIPEWSYLGHVTRRGVTVNRSAMVRKVEVAGRMVPDRYYFETLATDQRTSLAIVSELRQDASEYSLNLRTACTEGLRDTRCDSLLKTQKHWIQMSLGTWLSTFPPSQL